MLRQILLKNPILISIVVWVLVFLFLFPLAWLTISSFKGRKELLSIEPSFVFNPTLSNYKKLFFQLGPEGQITGTTDFLYTLFNSVIVTVFGTLITVIFGSLAAYGFSRFDYPAKDDLLFFVLATRMLPPIAIILAIYFMFRVAGLLDTRLGLMLVYALVNLSFSVWIMKGFFDEIPEEFEYAAMCDGYTRLQAFFKVILPQVYNGIAATALICAIFSWNEFLAALILTGEVAKTVPVNLAASAVGTTATNWGLIAAGTLIFVTPMVIFTFFVRDYLVRGLTFGIVKGQ
ncbi:MAG: carbohydrate ABC transporter permease [Candidatus Bipolaricaulota bacterium]|nr:carbohydrate ABC transporter permease [Candidatus Bipolaricaulota bacterium]